MFSLLTQLLETQAFNVKGFMLKLQQLATDDDIDIKLTKLTVDHAEGEHHVSAFFTAERDSDVQKLLAHFSLWSNSSARDYWPGNDKPAIGSLCTGRLFIKRHAGGDYEPDSYGPNPNATDNAISFATPEELLGLVADSMPTGAP